ncbi:MAG: cytochrome c biogenesis protein CcsA [Candidatus Homeothermus sp.]|nr:cytochrome c biogenesis protein CcsA [Candidatus Homeothermus sp.]
MRLSKPAWLLHISLLVIVVGGVMTWLTGDRGQVRLGKGEEVSVYQLADGSVRQFPFRLSLDSFTVAYYPGGEVPRDFVSYLRVDGEPTEVSVNNIASVNGYRLCQMSYDSEGHTVLSVNHDPLGIGMVYTGFLLFAVAGLWLMLSRVSGFRKAVKRLSAVTVLMLAVTGAASAETIAGVPRQQADSLSRKQVMYNGRVMTFNSLARDFTLKITGDTRYRGLSPEQFMASWLLYPEQWQGERAILVKDKALRDCLGLDGRYASLDDLFSASDYYRLRDLYGKGNAELDRAIEELDEKVGLIMDLLAGNLIMRLPDNADSMSAARVEVEIVYNQVPFSTLIFILLFCGAAVAFAGLFRLPKFSAVAVAFLCIALLLQLTAYILEWYMSGHIPLANTGETMEFLLLVLLPLLLVFHRTSALLLPVGMLFAGAVALVAHLIGSNPVLTPLMPVLASPWLSIHVTLVMTAYALFGFTVTCSVISFFSPSRRERLMWLDRVMLYPALYLLGLGIITGAVWANVSWGRYWAWDPKETWALVTFIIYAVAMHRSIKPLNHPTTFHAYMLFAFLAVLMTYFGVNALSSLHAYS